MKRPRCCRHNRSVERTSRATLKSAPTHLHNIRATWLIAELINGTDRGGPLGSGTADPRGRPRQLIPLVCGYLASRRCVAAPSYLPRGNSGANSRFFVYIGEWRGHCGCRGCPDTDTPNIQVGVVRHPGKLKGNIRPTSQYRM